VGLAHTPPRRAHNAGVDFTLRPLEPTDGPGIDALLRSEAQTTAVAITTRYRHDVYASLVAQHPTLFGVVATVPDSDQLVGMATAFTDEVQLQGRMFPSAHLENLKVRHDARRQGLGRRLAEWRIAEARLRSGAETAIAAGIEATNQASLATARHWASNVLGPVRVVIARTTSKRLAPDGVVVRPIEDGDIEAVVDGVNRFYADHHLYPRQTPAGLAAMLAPTDPGGRIRAYRVAVSADATIVAGACVMQRFELMTDHVERMPAPLALLARVAPIFPRDGVIRTAEVSLAWHAPGRQAAGRVVWDAIRNEWNGRATHVSGIADPRSGAAGIFRVGPSLGPRIRLMVAIHSPVQLDESRPVYLWR
jgi:predicted N-acetyltransferase YhbS